MPSVPGRMPDPRRPCAGLELPACSRGEFLIRNEAGRYTLLYDTAYRQAAWVAYLLTREDVRRRGAKRRNAFRCDPEVVARGWPTAVDRDYAGSGFDRGHLLPSADRDDSRAENDATFYLSNVSPQYPKLNRNQWRLLEEQVRRWADRYDSIYVVTGGELEPGLRRIRGGTGIPRHYFKALLARAEKGWRAIAFRLPNVASPEGSWTDYSLSVDRLEELTGIDFFPALPDSIERRVESRVDARVLEIGTGVFFHRRASLSREHFWYLMGLGSVRVDMNLAGGISARFVAAGRGAPCFPARLRQTFAGSGRRFARGIFRFTVSPARTEGYGAIFAITV